MPKIRFLLADDTGAGKTIMTGLLVKEMLMQGIAERILMVTPGGLTKQWQEDELGVKFNLPFTWVNRSLFSSDPNVFHTANRVEYTVHYEMSRDDEAEAIAMQTAMGFETHAGGWKPKDVSANNEGYDIKSVSPEELRRYKEVKGRSGNDGSVMLSENEMNRLAQLGESAWLYTVTNCKSQPELHRIQNPAKSLKFELKTQGIQYFLPMAE